MARSRGSRQAVPAQTGPDPLERKRADWDQTIADMRDLLRQGHELVAALRDERAATERALSAAAPETLRPVVDARVASAVSAGLELYEARIRTAIGDGVTRVYERFDALMAALLGDGGDPEGTLQESLERFLVRQRVLAEAAASDPRPARNVTPGPDGVL